MLYSLKGVRTVLFSCFYLLVCVSCGSSLNPEDNPPEIPPLETMTIDVSLFDNAPLQATSTTSKQNFVAAALLVTTFNVAVLSAFSVPTLATAAALSADPVFEEDEKFHWRFFFEQVSPAVSIDLSAQVNPNTVNWEMRVTRGVPPLLADFLWYDGVSQIDGSSGHWQFYDVQRRPASHTAARIDWQFVSEDDRTLTFTNNNDASDGVGDVLQYQVADHDVSVVFVDASESDTTEVGWDRTTGEGFIIAPNLNDGNKACWDSNQDDVACDNTGISE